MEKENKDNAEKGDGFVIYLNTILHLPLKDLPKGKITIKGNVLVVAEVFNEEKIILEKSIDTMNSWMADMPSIPALAKEIYELAKEIGDEEFGQKIVVEKDLILRYSLVLKCKNLKEALLLTDQIDNTPETIPNTLALHYDAEYNEKCQQESL